MIFLISTEDTHKDSRPHVNEVMHTEEWQPGTVRSKSVLIFQSSQGILPSQ